MCELLKNIWIFLQNIAPVAIFLFLIVNLFCYYKLKQNVKEGEESVRLIKKDLWYIVIIFGIILTFILVIAFSEDDNAFQYFSFASTITSMVLSVVAIIMTIVNELKSDGVKTAIDDSVKTLRLASEQIEKYAEQIGEQSETLKKILTKTDENLLKSKEIMEQTQTILAKTASLEQTVKNASKKELGEDDYQSDDGGTEN